MPDKCHANCNAEFMAYADCGLKMYGCADTCGNAPTHMPLNATNTPSNATNAPTEASKSPEFKAGVVTALMLGAVAVSSMCMFLV